MRFRLRIPALVRTWQQSVLGAVGRRLDARHRCELITVRRGLTLPPLPRVSGRQRLDGAVWAVTMVKDEEDVIETTVRHLFDQGVDGVLVSDNGSTDETRAILERLASQFNLHIADDAEQAYYQGTKMSLLADWARRAGARWIIPFDADELWFAPEGTLKTWLGAQTADIVTAPINNTFPSRQGWVLDAQQHLHPKVAFRAHRLAWLAMGNHDVLRPGRRASGLHILHIPWRSFEQFARKTRAGAAALAASDLPGGAGSHWRDVGALAEDDLRHLWGELLDGLDDPALGWTPSGRLVATDPRAWTTWDPDQVLVEPARADRPPHGLDVVYLRPREQGFGRIAVAAWVAGDLLGDHYRVVDVGTAPPAPKPGRRMLVVVARVAHLDETLRAGWRPGADVALWVVEDSTPPAAIVVRVPGPVFAPAAIPVTQLQCGTRVAVEVGADVLRAPALRADRWVDVTGDAASANGPALAATAGLRWRSLGERRATPWEDQRGLWAGLGRSRLALFAPTSEAAWWPDALASGTLVTGALPAPALNVLGDLALGEGDLRDGVSAWTPSVARELRRRALGALDWRHGLLAISRHLGVTAGALEADLDRLSSELERDSE